MVDKADVEVIQLKAVHFIGFCFVTQDIAMKMANPVLF